MTQIPESVIKKIQKLLSLADGAAKVGSMAEAENAAAKAQQILIEYNLSLEEVNSFKDQKKVITDEYIDPSKLYMGKEGKWIFKLYQVIAQNNLCTIISYNKGEALALIGTESNREIVKYFVSYLIPQIRKLARSAFKDYDGIEKKGTFIRGYLLGCVAGIHAKLNSQLSQMKNENPNIQALVKVSGQELEEYKDKKWPNLRKVTIGRSSSESGFSQGFEKGKNMDLHKGIKGRNSAFNSGLLN